MLFGGNAPTQRHFRRFLRKRPFHHAAAVRTSFRRIAILSSSDLKWSTTVAMSWSARGRERTTDPEKERETAEGEGTEEGEGRARENKRATVTRPPARLTLGVSTFLPAYTFAMTG